MLAEGPRLDALPELAEALILVIAMPGSCRGSALPDFDLPPAYAQSARAAIAATVAHTRNAACDRPFVTISITGDCSRTTRAGELRRHAPTRRGPMLCDIGIVMYSHKAIRTRHWTPHRWRG